MKDQSHKEDLLTASGVSICLYLLIIYLTLFEPTSQAMWDHALGPMPYGLPQRLFVLLWITAICLPLPYGFYHASVTLRFTKREVNRSMSDLIADHVVPFKTVFSYIRYLISNEGVPTFIKRSKLITMSLIVYLIVIVTAWIIWAEAKGI